MKQMFDLVNSNNNKLHVLYCNIYKYMGVIKCYRPTITCLHYYYYINSVNNTTSLQSTGSTKQIFN